MAFRWALLVCWLCACAQDSNTGTSEPRGASQDGGSGTAVSFTSQDSVQVEGKTSVSPSSVAECRSATCDPISSAGCTLGSGVGVCRLGQDEPVCTLPSTETPKSAGQACNTADECVAGHDCIALTSHTKVCTPLCCVYQSECATGSLCVSSASQPWGHCAAESVCDPVANIGCGGTSSCYLISENVKTACLATGSLGEAASCHSANACAPGLACVGVSQKTCRTLCKLGSACNVPGAACVAQSYTPAGMGICVHTKS